MIKVAVFEDNLFLQEQLLELLKTDPSLEVCGGWVNCLKIKKIMSFYQPDVVLMDIEMPEADGMEGLRYVVKEYPQVAVIMLTVFEDDVHVLESICLGAKGYLLKKTAPEKILEAVHDTLAGGSPMTPSVARKVLKAFTAIKQVAPTDYKFTPREKDILQSLVEGNSYKMIAASLGISLNTVRQYIRSIYEKLQVHSMNEAVAKAIKQQLV